MSKLKHSNKILNLGHGCDALFNVSASSRCYFDKYTRLCSYSIGFEYIKVFDNPADADEEFKNMNNEDAMVCFSGIPYERKLRLAEGTKGKTMLLPLN